MEKLDFIDSKFRLAILAAKRGKQLVAGAKKKVDTSAENPLTIAIEEIFQGKVKIRILKENELNINEENASLLIGNDEDALDYESNVEEMLYRDDGDEADSEEQDKDF